jgi:hypothetical protein
VIKIKRRSQHLLELPLEAVRRNMPLAETSTDVTSPKFGIEFT